MLIGVSGKCLAKSAICCIPKNLETGLMPDPVDLYFA